MLKFYVFEIVCLVMIENKMMKLVYVYVIYNIRLEKKIFFIFIELIIGIFYILYILFIIKVYYFFNYDLVLVVEIFSC